MKTVPPNVELLALAEALATYMPRFIPLGAYVTIINGTAYDVDNDGVVLDLSSFGLPAGMKAVALSITGTCPTAAKWFRVGPDSTNNNHVELREPVANGWICVSGICGCDANGDSYVTTDAVHGAEFTIYARVTGYWI